GLQNLDVANVLQNLGLVMRKLKRSREAREHLGRALAIQQALYGAHHPSVAMGANALGAVWSDRDSGEALRWFEQSLAVTIRTFGSDHPQAVLHRNNLLKMQKIRSRIRTVWPLLGIVWPLAGVAWLMVVVLLPIARVTDPALLSAMRIIEWVLAAV